MTQKNKELLLKYLCMALPYGVICKIHYTFNNETTFGEDVEAEADCPIVRIDVQAQTVYVDLVYDWFCIDEIKPYLRPMSSMTEEEKNEWISLMRKEYREQYLHSAVNTSYYEYFPTIESFDYLNAHHFDYRNLIERELAIEVTESNNPYEH